MLFEKKKLNNYFSSSILQRKFEAALKSIDRSIALSKKLPPRKQLSYHEKRMTILLYLDKYNEVLEECAYIDERDEDYMFISSTLFHKAHAQFYLADLGGAMRTAGDYLEVVGWHENEAEYPDEANMLVDGKSVHDILVLMGMGHLHGCLHEEEFVKLVEGREGGRGGWPFNGVLNLSEEEMKGYGSPCEVLEEDLKQLKGMFCFFLFLFFFVLFCFVLNFFLNISLTCYLFIFSF